MSLADRLRAARQEAGLSQEALARLTNLSVNTIRAIEWGHSQSPGVKTMQEISRALGVSLSDLLDGGDYDTP